MKRLFFWLSVLGMAAVNWAAFHIRDDFISNIRTMNYKEKSSQEGTNFFSFGHACKTPPGTAA